MTRTPSPAALEELRRRHAGAVEAFLHGLQPGPRVVLREAVDETFARFAASLRDGPLPTGPALPLLLAIARELVHERAELRGPRRAIHELPDEERAVFVLRHDLLCTWEDVAIATGSTLERAMGRMRAALARLAPRLVGQAAPGCPPRDQLLLAREGLLDEDACEALGAHLERCADCCLVRVELERALARPEPRPRAQRPPAAPVPPETRPVEAQPELRAARVRLRCPYCHDELPEPRASGWCETCLAPHHPDCFTELGRCAISGCGGMHLLRPGGPQPRAVAIPRRRLERFTLLLGGAVLGVALSLEADHRVGNGDSVRIHAPLVVRPAPLVEDDIEPDQEAATLVAQHLQARRRFAALRALESLLRARAAREAVPEAERVAFQRLAEWRAHEPGSGPRDKEQLALGLDRLLSAGIAWAGRSLRNDGAYDATPTIHALDPEGHASRVRLSVGDRIVAVNGVDTPDLLALTDALGRAEESSVSMRVRCSDTDGVLKVRLDLPR